MIVVFGSVGMDLIFAMPHLPAVGETVLTPALSVAMGGKGANQAVAAARDGGRVRFVGSVGADSYGNEARTLLGGEAIDLGGLATVDGVTCVAGIFVDRQGRNQIPVASGANLATHAGALIDAHLGRGDWLVLQMEIRTEEVVQAITLAKSRGARIILNLAPSLPLELAALRQVDVLVVNEHEAGDLAGRLELNRAVPVELAAPLARVLGINVIVTLGADGAIGARPDEQTCRVPALRVDAVDTTGAGDCFVGVLATALDRGTPLDQSLRRACVAATLACTTMGAAPSFPNSAAIDAAARGTGGWV